MGMSNENKHRASPEKPSLEEGKLLNVNEFVASVALKDAPQPPAIITGSIADRPPITSPPHHLTYEDHRTAQETAARLRGEQNPFAR